MKLHKLFTSLTLFSFLNVGTLYATNGDQMIATGTKSMGMGGVSIAMPFGAESGLANPALITYVKESEISGSATLFFPNIETKTKRILSSKSGKYQKSDSTFYLMPSVQYATHLGGAAYAGLGVWGVAGMGVDFSGSGDPLLFGMKDDLMIMHIAAPLALRQGGLRVGIAPILQVGMLDIEMMGSKIIDKDWEANPGAVIGLAYDFDNGLILGAKYRTPISMNYSMERGNDFALQQPGEFGIGFSYNVGPHTLAFDYKLIQWGSAVGYGDMGWSDQSVYAVGYQYRSDDWTFRLGYNYGKSPINTGSAQALEDYFNLLGFPATSKEHYTIGGTYSIDKSLTLDLAAVYSPRVTTQGNLVGRSGGATVNEFITNRHAEFSLSAQLNYTF